MFFRALTAFSVLLGLVAGSVPYLLFMDDPWRGESYFTGLFIMSAGLLILLWCVRDFYVAGKGTLAPWSPPKHLVMVGLYRWYRNPMYIGVLILVAGWAVFTASPLLCGYFLILILGFHLHVVLYEEPLLARLFSDTWKSYSASVPRWLPGFKILRKNIKTS